MQDAQLSGDDEGTTIVVPWHGNQSSPPDLSSYSVAAAVAASAVLATSSWRWYGARYRLHRS
jgi:hypothetical protein